MGSRFWNLFLLLFPAFIHASNALNSEGQILLALSNGLILPSSVSSSWNSSDRTPCGWVGIHCDRSGFVDAIKLAERRIYGSLGKEIGSLSQLKKIDIGVNNLSGIIPPELGNCSLLEHLDLSSNSLSGEIPLTFHNLKNLSYLSVFSNFLSGEIPEQLFWGPNLETVYLNDNNLAGTIPSFGAIFCRIQFLWLSQNNLSGPLPDSIGNCSELEELYLYDNQLTGPLPSSVNQLRELRFVDVNTNDLEGSIPFGSDSCKLEVVILEFNRFEGEIPMAIGNCNNLTTFSTVNNNLSGQIPSTLGLLPKLEILYLSSNSLSGSIPSEIGQCESLKALELFDNQLGGFIPRELGNLTNLEKLYLFDNNLTGDVPIEIWKLPNLTHVLIYNNNLSGALPVEMCELTNLRNVSLYNNQFRGVIPQCLGINSNLVQIDFTNSSLVGGIPPNICSGNQLTVLNLGLNQLNGTIPQGIGSCFSLQRLILRSNSLNGQIPEFSVASSLLYMDLSWNRLDGRIPQSLSNCENVTMINLSNNKIDGPIPQGIGNLFELKVMNLSNNNLYGLLPPQISQCSRLFSLDLGFNSLNGTIPTSLTNLTLLSQLVLEGNQFSGGIPDFLSNFSGLLELQLGGNKFGGSIPSSLGLLANLDVALNISDNGLTGQLPSDLGNLVMLQSLDISFNNLTGSLMVLGKMSSLVHINVSYNRFSGPLPNGWLKFVEFSPSSFLGNPQLCISCPVGDSICANITVLQRCALSSSSSKGRFKIGIALVILGSLLFTALLLLVVLCLLKFKRTSKCEGPSLHEGSSFLLNQLIEATQNLDQKYEIGRGAHGIVYKAVLETGKQYAIKKFVFVRQNGSNASMLREIQTIGKIRHRNLVKLENFWLKREYGLILYQYMENGSLHNVLHELEPAPELEWNVRYRIAVGTAQGLDYLHNDCNPAIIHRDIKPKNILLDTNMEPHISDFGIAKLLDQYSASPQSTAVMGTLGYISPESAFTTRKTKESDVYSYGIVLLELLTRRKAVDSSFPENMDIVSWITSTLDGNGEMETVVDRDLMAEVMGTPEMEQVNKVLHLAIRCTVKAASRRPSMQNVVRELTDIKSRFINSQKQEKTESISL